MSDDLTRLETLGAGLLAQLGPGPRARLARTIATDLRRSQARRIKANTNPDGSAYAPRRPQRRKKGAIKRGAMFRKLGLLRAMRTHATPSVAMVSYIRRVARIAQVHQEGLRDRVSPGGPWADYPARELLGFSAQDTAMIQDKILQHLAGGLRR